MLELYSTHSRSDRILNFFSEFDNFQSSAKKPADGVSSWLEQTMIVQHQYEAPPTGGFREED